MAYWALAVNILFPVPLICLLLLCLPLPSVVRRFVIKFVDMILFVKIGNLNIYRVATALSSFLFLGTTWEMMHASEKLDAQRSMNLQFKEEKTLCNKWRAERNFWIALFSVVLWLILYRVQVMSREAEAAKAAKREEAKTN